MAIHTDIPEGEVFIGEDKLLTWSVTDDDGAAVDISGWAMRWILSGAPAASATSPLLTKTTGGSGLVGDAGGDATVTLADTDTDDLRVGMYHYNLWRTDDGFETVLAYGTLPLGLP
jgi:hypothetical protein